MKKYVIGLGEALWDMLPAGKQLGGAPANFAYHVHQLGFDSVAVSALGKDDLGDEILSILDKKGLQHQMARVDYPTGTVEVTLDDKGVPCYEIKEGVAWDNIPFTPELEDLAHNTVAVCFGSLAQRNSVSRNTIEKFLDAVPQTPETLMVFDINLRQHFYSKEIIENSLKRSNILKINDEELVIVAKMFEVPSDDVYQQCRWFIQKYGLKLVILTCGAKGSIVVTPDKEFHAATPKVDVADTVGAGDSFTAAFTAALLKGKSIEEGHALASSLATYVCTQHGAMPELPDEFKKALL